MFLRTATEKYTEKYFKNIEILKEKLNSADCIVIGAGAGLSTSAGFTYSGERFEKYFSDFSRKYGFDDMYSGGFYPYNSSEEFWAYWSRYIYINRYVDAPNDLYNKLFGLVNGKDYFVITTNVDHCFQKSGFDKKRLFYTQGDYGLFQCSVPCCQQTFDNEKQILKMYNSQKNMKIPTELIPKCSHCGKEMTTNLRCDDKFIEDEGWHSAAQRYNDFIRTRAAQKILFLELGVGYNTPAIIKYPFWKMTAENKNATYCLINYGQSYCPEEIKNRAVCFNCDIYNVIADLQDN